MSILKIHLYRGANQKQQRYLLTFMPEVHKTVRDFLGFALKTLEIQCTIDHLVIQYDGYVIPHCLNGEIVQKAELLIIKVKHPQRTSPPVHCWTAQKGSGLLEIQGIQIPKIIQSNQMNQEDSLSSSSTPKFSEDGLNKQNLTKKLLKHSNKKPAHKQASIKGTKQNKNKPEVQQKSESQQQQDKRQRKLIKEKAHKKKKIVQPQPQQSEQDQQIEQSSESSQQSSQEQLPRVTRSKKDKMKQKVQTKNVKLPQSKSKNIQQSSQMIAEIRPKLTREDSFGKRQKEEKQQEIRMGKTNKSLETSQLPVKSVNYSQRRKLIQVDDIQSSDSDSGQNENHKVAFMNRNKQKVSQPKMIPSSLRNKIQAKDPTKSFKDVKSPSKTSPQNQASFKKHVQQQWLTITKQIIQKFNKQNSSPQQKTFLKPNNLIKFRQIELDEQKFVPKTSEWIQATIQSIQSDGKLKLAKVTQLGKDYRQRYEIYDYNMVQLQVNKNYLTKQQISLISTPDGSQQGKHIQVSPVQQPSPVVQQAKKSQDELKKSQDEQKCSLEKFICGQVNFYFSDRNYPFDLHMQMHANNNPQKYIPIRFLLNFPKIKKIIKDQKKIFQYLVEDENREVRNFQVNEEKRMVRKKLSAAQVKFNAQQRALTQTIECPDTEYPEDRKNQ